MSCGMLISDLSLFSYNDLDNILINKEIKIHNGQKTETTINCMSDVDRATKELLGGGGLLGC
jgi:hypothetical protein